MLKHFTVYKADPHYIDEKRIWEINDQNTLKRNQHIFRVKELNVLSAYKKL